MLIRRVLQYSSHLRISASLGHRITSLSRHPVMQAHSLPVLPKTSRRQLHAQTNSHDINDVYDEEYWELKSKLKLNLTDHHRNLLEEVESSRLRGLINNFKKLAELSKNLEEDAKFFLFKKLESDHIFNLIKEECCLFLTLNSLSLKKPMEFLKFLGPDHIKCIKIKFVDLLLKHVGEDKQHLLDFLDTEQLRASLDEFTLRDVLKQINSKERFNLLNRLGKDFLVEKLTYRFYNCLELLPEQDQKSLLNLLGTDYLVKTIKFGYDLERALKCLDKNNHQCLLNLLGPKHLSKLIQSESLLVDVLKILNPSDRMKQLTSLGADKLWKMYYHDGDREKVKELLVSEAHRQAFDAMTLYYPSNRLV